MINKNLFSVIKHFQIHTQTDINWKIEKAKDCFTQIIKYLTAYH